MINPNYFYAEIDHKENDLMIKIQKIIVIKSLFESNQRSDKEL